MSRLFVLVFLLSMAACAELKKYDVTFNETLVYTPRAIAVSEDIRDSALRACIEQHLKDQSVKKPESLKTLACTQAGIRDLTGITLYRGLEANKLTNNQIQSLAPINQLEA